MVVKFNKVIHLILNQKIDILVGIKIRMRKLKRAFITCEQYKANLSRLYIGKWKLTHEYLMSIGRSPTSSMENTECENLRLTIS